MKVLVIGGGGREHALAWKCAQSRRVTEVLVAPGNAGTAFEPRMRNVPVAADDIDALLDLATREGVGLTIVGPEAPLVAGVVDRFDAAGLPCFGPHATAAQLEGSKAFTKDFLQRHGIPTAEYESFTEIEPALAYIRERGAPIVVKADGLAAGKGVVVAAHVDVAIAAAIDMLGGDRFGSAGRRIVVEEFLRGEEASFIVMTDGTSVLPLATSQDHKARDDGDAGPNTGGMGAYSPAPVVTQAMADRIMREIVQPTLDGLASEGISYRGFLYAGIMITADGTPKVLEYNCRFGDPETQPIMMRLRSDFVGLCSAGVDGTLGEHDVEWDPRAALGVVMAAGGYPESYDKGLAITGLETGDSADCKVFHAGTRLKDGRVVTSGGRVLCVVGLGGTVSEAQARAYRRVGEIHWPGEFHRGDIGYRAIAREQ
ncbi:MAG: phosphoribosylamine--glycine ligase [Gammaproteobacteria bacterium]|nr:phosphoribosylamine--glycine ligase [Gammaproteobacteria bacterium]MDH4253092.1 phosphoribosylamine--glycine ligase [Gammaproteobacteria bacterium]MDH5308918.1 phosphoribosylamine--glycine ligase [Gammaproteobacteria bacterium]